MKLVIINVFRECRVVEASTIPAKGAQIDMYYKPNPTVTNVVMWPRDDTLNSLGIKEANVEAIVFVS